MSSWRDEPKRWYSVHKCGCVYTSVNHPWVGDGITLAGENVHTCDTHRASAQTCKLRETNSDAWTTDWRADCGHKISCEAPMDCGPGGFPSPPSYKFCPECGKPCELVPKPGGAAEFRMKGRQT